MLDLREIFLFKKHKYIVIDTEACNLNLVSRDNLPWQISWIECKGEEILSEHDYFPFWKNLKVSKGAAIVTHFDYYDYKKKAIDPSIVLDDLIKYIENPEYFIVWHRGIGYDMQILRNFYEMCGREFPSESILSRNIDTNCLSKAYIEEIAIPQNEDFLTWQYKLDNLIKKGLKTNIKRMCELLGIPYNENAHNAFHDIDMCKEIFIKLIYKLS
jgi:DNA polymerase III epsilon subunit-like protein